jgi:predicted nucleic acid-binding protein
VTIAYFDTSALLKQYVIETGSFWLHAYLDATPVPSVFTSSLTIVEASCAFARRLRDGTLTPEFHTTVTSAFEYDVIHRYHLLDVTPDTIEMACRLAKEHPLRAYDAMQLATAWLLNRDLLEDGQVPLTFICADDRLVEIVQAAGLLTENPNHHPRL